MLGYSAAEVVGLKTAAVWHDSSELKRRVEILSLELDTVVQPSFEALVAKTRLNLADENEWTIIRKDGSRFPGLLSVTPLRDDSGAIAGFLGIIADISERRRGQQKLEKAFGELERSNRELEQFAYVASHDLQEPLRAVAGCVQILAKRYAGKLDASGLELIGHAVDGAQRMQQLIHDLLALSRVGSHGGQFARVDSSSVCRAAMRNLAMAIAESGADIEYAGLPFVFGDPVQLSLLFQNLIGNSIKYRKPSTPEIRIRANRSDDFWQFSIQDNGIGIEAQYFERIFGVFQRLHTRTEYTGTGIGLAICKKIVERHGGRIWVESILGDGAIFYFTLPAVNVEKSA
jgi:light-regulated signal transduction histidine kinase (bacteriophytochrome)